MMSEHMNFMMSHMGAVGWLMHIAILVLVILAIAALIKYLFTSGK
ncbi:MULTISPECIES: hypothetical protein [unclassified Halomonas]|nr:MULTISPECIES: hypothetical protein [unclassified Halomonas]